MVIGQVIDYLEQVPGEFASIEREFEGTVNCTVDVDSKFEAVLGKIDVRFRLVGPRCRVNSFSPVLVDPPALWTLRCDILPSFSTGHSAASNHSVIRRTQILRHFASGKCKRGAKIKE